MSTSSELRARVREALLDAFRSENAIDQLVQDALNVNRARITTRSGMEAMVDELLDHCQEHGCVAQLVCTAYNLRPGNRLVSQLAAEADAWPELSNAGFVLNQGEAFIYASRQKELAYLEMLLEGYKSWAAKYTPLAGIAEVREAVGDRPSLDLPMLFMPTGFEKLVAHGFGPQRERRRVEVTDLRQAVTEYKRLVLLGEPGAGKTTTLRRLAYDLAQAARGDDSARLPLPVPLGGYTGSETALDYLQGYFDDLGPHVPAYLQRGRAVLLLDGLNEMPTQDYQARVGCIQTLLDGFPATPVLVTCRALDHVEVLKLEKLEVKRLDPERQRAYLHRYLGEQAGEALFWHLMGEELSELWSVWQDAGGTWEQFWSAGSMPQNVYRKTSWRQHRLREALQTGELPPLLALGANPYMLVMLAQVYAAQQGALPQNRAKLFAAFADTLLAREERRHVPERWPGAQALIHALSTLAYAMQSAGERGTAVDRDWALAQLDDDHDPEQILYLAAGATLLDLAGAQVRFVHQLIQEYFAMLAWQHTWEAGAALSEQWPADWLEPTGWEETAVLLAGLLPDMTGLIDAMLAVNPPLAARCIAESGGKSPDAACIGRVQEHLASIATGTEFSARHRNLAGNALNHVGDPRPGVGLNEDGLPDIVWRPVPAGTYLMGNTKETDEMAYDDEAPQHLLHVDEYSIAKVPITNAQYTAFVRDGGYTPRQQHCWTEAGWRWRSDELITRPRTFGGAFDLPNHPVVGVSWYEAVAFCNWLGEQLELPIMLPSEAQWEKAARGTDGRRYPWGDDISPEHANYDNTDLGATSAVGIFARAESPYGALDMAGNVWEWCRTQWRENYEDYERQMDDDPRGDVIRTLRGGSFNRGDYSVRCANRLWFNPNFRLDFIGFRIVRSSGS